MSDSGHDTSVTALRAGALDALPDAVMVVSGDCIEWANAGAAALFGEPVAALVGRRLEDLLAPGDYERMEARCRLRERGAPVPEVQRLRVRKPGGAEVPVDARVGVLAEGEGASYVLSFRDRKQSARAEALVTELARLTSEAQKLGDVAAVIDRAAPVLFEHGWYAALFAPAPGGYRAERVVIPDEVDDDFARYVRSIVGKTRPPEELPITTEVFRSGRTFYLDEAPSRLALIEGRGQVLGRNMLRDGLQRGAFVPVCSDQGVSHVLIAIGASFSENDVAAMELLAGQIAVALRIEALRAELLQRGRLSAIGEMAAVLAHEVRNPLTVILNAVRGLGRLTAASTEGDPAAQLVEVLREEAERLRSLARDLLALANPPSVALVDTAVEPAVRKAVTTAAQDAAWGRGIAVDVQVASTAEVLADAKLVERAVRNLLLHAAHHAAAGSAIEVTVAERATFVEIAIHHDGPSLPAETMARVFDPFVSPRASGTGLGLAVVRRIAEDLGGYVRADNVPRGGVTFTIGLPATVLERA